MIGIVWFIMIAALCLIVWRLHVADKRAKEEQDRRYGNKSKKD